MSAEITITPTVARRLALMRQRLAGPRPLATPEEVLGVVRDLGCLQLDPLNVVARSHLLVLWSRLGVYDPAVLDQLLWQERSLFEYWAHCASIVLTEDYPIHSDGMRHFATESPEWSQKVQRWMTVNQALRDSILGALAERGPLRASDFEDCAVEDWASSGWTAGRNVERMIRFLWGQGHIMVAGRAGLQKIWDLSARCLPEWTPREVLSAREVVTLAAQKALRALGVASAAQIQEHFIRGSYPNLTQVLATLEAEGRVVRVAIVDEGGAAWPGPWYVHTEDLSLVERLRGGEWEPRTTLLSPFDNLICDRARTEQFFHFRYRVEIYVPKAKRQYGYYVLPILHGDRLIGRVDPKMDRKQRRLTINALYAEPDAPMTAEAGQGVAAAISELGRFLGATQIDYPSEVPAGWAPFLG